MKKRCVIYARVSTDEQVEEGQSIENQITICSRFAEQNDYIIVQTFEDAGKSGRSMKRPALQEMLNLCDEDKNLDAVLVLNTDRWARNSHDHMEMKNLLSKNNIELVSVTQPSLSGTSSTVKLADGVFANFNEYFSNVTSEKVILANLEKIKAGWKPGPAPLGYLNKRDGNMGIIVVDEERAPFVVKVFEMYATGLYSVERLTDELALMGFSNRKGEKVARTVLFNILHNPFYIGKLRYKGKLYSGSQTPLIGAELFDTCNAVLISHNQGADRGRKHHYLLRGYLLCGHCGSRMYGERHTKASGTVFDHYFCKKCEKSHYSDTSKIEDQVKEYFKLIKLPKAAKEQAISMAETILGDIRKNIDDPKKQLTAQKSKLESKRMKVEEKLFGGVINDDTYTRHIKLIEDELDEIETKLSKSNKDRSKNVATFQMLMGIASDVYKAYCSAPDEIKRLYLELFFEDFYIKDKQIEKAVPSLSLKALLSPNSQELSVRTKILWLRVVNSVVTEIINSNSSLKFIKQM